MSKSDGMVLVVDDEKPMRNALERLLHSAGYECLLFADGHELLDSLPYNKPGCILLDLRLSENTGLDVQAELRNQDNNLPIIFMSGYGTIKSTVEAIRHGAVDFLAKPFEDEELLTAIDKAVGLHHQRLRQYKKIQAAQQRYNQLSVREKEVMSCVISGARIKNIAMHLEIAEKTVKIHKARIMEKMQADSVVELYRQAELLGVHLQAIS